MRRLLAVRHENVENVPNIRPCGRVPSTSCSVLKPLRRQLFPAHTLGWE